MRAFLLALFVAGWGAYGAAVVLEHNFQSPTHAAFTTEGARVSDPGRNLIVN